MGWQRSKTHRQGESIFSPGTDNASLNRQIQSLREHEMREVPFPTPITPALAATARQLMLEACDGRLPRRASDSDSELLREEFINKYFGEEMLAELPEIMAQKAEEEPGKRWRRLKRHILINPTVPLILRVIVLSFVLASLGLAAKLHSNTASQGSPCGRTPDITYLIVWTSFAALYLILVELDDFRAAPIGLRRPWTKFAITISDFIFVAFFTAAIGLGFSIHTDWRCGSTTHILRGTRGDAVCGTSGPQVCKLVRSVSALMIVSGFMWAVMFCVTVSRLLAHAVYAPGASGGGAVTIRRRGTIKSRYQR